MILRRLLQLHGNGIEIIRMVMKHNIGAVKFKQNIQFSQNSLFSIYTWYGCAKYSV